MFSDGLSAGPPRGSTDAEQKLRAEADSAWPTIDDKGLPLHL